MKTFTIALYSMMSLLGFLEIWDAFIDFLAGLGFYTALIIPGCIILFFFLKKWKKENTLKKRYGRPLFTKN